MRDFHKAMVLVISSCVAIAGILAAAAIRERARFTSAELMTATRAAVRESIAAAIEAGGLYDSESFVEERISEELTLLGFPRIRAEILRSNDFDELAAFNFDVVAGGLSVRFNLQGVRDPLLSIRLGLDYRWWEDPNHPYGAHGGSAVLSECLTNHYFHFAADAPDFFARLENRTEDPYHFGVETFLVMGRQLAVDHLLLGGNVTMDEGHRKLYGLAEIP